MTRKRFRLTGTPRWTRRAHALPVAALAALLVSAPVLARAPDGPATRAQDDPRVAKAELALARGQVEEALALATAASAARPRDVRARLLLARLHLEQGTWEQAYVEIDRALELAPRNVDALAYMALVSGRLAAASFDRLAAQAPGSARVKQLEAETLELQGRRAEAETAYEAALAVDPRRLEVLLALGRLKRVRLACDEALPLYERAEAIRPTFDAAFGLGTCLAFAQDAAAAVQRFEQAVERDPTAAVAWSGLGTALVKIGRTGDGIAALSRAVTIEPKMSDGWYMLGMAYQAAGDGVQAKQAFARAEALRTRPER